MLRKYRKEIAFAALMLAAVLVFAGCKKKQEEPAQNMSEETTAATTAKVQQEADRSITTGKLTNKNNYPILVSIPNDGTARPHYNISKADIVYEMYVEGSITRLLALYNDNIPDRVGPVRSGRMYMVDIVDDWRGAFVHFGGPRAANDWSLHRKLIKSQVQYRLDGISNSTYFARDNSRKAPNNAYVNLQGFASTIDAEPVGAQPFKFSTAPSKGTEDVKEIKINYSGSNNVTYKYNDEKGAYDRFINNNEYVDAVDGKQVAFQNIVIQETTQTNFGDVKGHINLDMLGTGKASFYFGGKMIKGTWTRTSKNKPTVYKDENGKEIKLSVGTTFVQIVTNAVGVTNN